MKDDDSVISGVIATRKNLVEVVVLAVVLAFAVELISGGIIDIFVLSPVVTITMGSLLAVGSIMYFIRALFGRRNRLVTYDAFFIYDEDNNEVLPVSRYDLSDEMSRCLKAAFAENPALEKQWQDEPLRAIRENKSHGLHKSRKSIKLIHEVIEYIVLEYLSTHLVDYFNQNEINEDRLMEFRRENLPDVLLSNRFLELFSRSMDDRVVFSDDEKPKGVSHRGEIIFAYEGPYKYSRFDLVLPKASKITRSKSGGIVIETKRVKLELQIQFTGFNTFIADDFLELYMNIPFGPSYDEFMVEISVSVSTKILALVSRTAWEYYHWIDSFLDALKENVSTIAFLNKINWETAITMHHIRKNVEKNRDSEK